MTVLIQWRFSSYDGSYNGSLSYKSTLSHEGFLPYDSTLYFMKGPSPITVLYTYTAANPHIVPRLIWISSCWVLSARWGKVLSSKTVLGKNTSQSLSLIEMAKSAFLKRLFKINAEHQLTQKRLSWAPKETSACV